MQNRLEKTTTFIQSGAFPRFTHSLSITFLARPDLAPGGHNNRDTRCMSSHYFGSYTSSWRRGRGREWHLLTSPSSSSSSSFIYGRRCIFFIPTRRVEWFGRWSNIINILWLSSLLGGWLCVHYFLTTRGKSLSIVSCLCTEICEWWMVFLTSFFFYWLADVYIRVIC